LLYFTYFVATMHFLLSKEVRKGSRGKAAKKLYETPILKWWITTA
jgi:hypothetical protein